MTYDNELIKVDEIPLKNSSRLVILGAPKVGKTCVVNWFLSKVFEDCYIPTIENFHKKVFKIRGEMFSVEILDTSGNSPFPAMKKLNIMTGDHFVLVFNLADIHSYVQVKQLCDEIKEIKSSKSSKGNSLATNILILGNKLDFFTDTKNKTTIQNQRCVSTIDAQCYAASLKSCYYAEISCKTMWGLTNAFHNFLDKSNLPLEILPTKHRRLSFERSFNFRHEKTRDKKSMHKLRLPQVNELDNNHSSITDVPSIAEIKTSNKLEIDDNREGFKKMAFRRQLSEACGKILTNSRRPSIRSEMKLLEMKSDKKTKTGQYSFKNRMAKKISNPDQYKKNKFQLFISGVIKLFQKSN